MGRDRLNSHLCEVVGSHGGCHALEPGQQSGVTGAQGSVSSCIGFLRIATHPISAEFSQGERR